MQVILAKIASSELVLIYCNLHALQVTRNSLREDKLLRSKAVVVNGADALIDPIEDEACKVQ